MKRGTPTVITIILMIVVIAVAAVGVGLAYQAYTDNSGNSASVDQKMILVYDSTGVELEAVHLPNVTYSGANTIWTAGYYDTHLTGKIVVNFPERYAWEKIEVKGTKTVSEINSIEAAPGDIYRPSNSGNLNGGTLSVTNNDLVEWDGNEWYKIGFKANKKVAQLNGTDNSGNVTSKSPGDIYMVSDDGGTLKDGRLSVAKNDYVIWSEASCNIRVWIEMKNIQSWSAVEKVTFRFQNIEYVLFNDKASGMSTTNHTNVQEITVEPSKRGVMQDFVLNVTYKDLINFDPSLVEDFMVSNMVFVLDEDDPLDAKLKVTFKQLEGNGNNYYPYMYYDDLFYGELLPYHPPFPVPSTINPSEISNTSLYKTYWVYLVGGIANNYAEWDFSNNLLNSSDFKRLDGEPGYYNLNLYPRLECKTTFVYEDNSGNHEDVEWCLYSKTSIPKANPQWDGHTFKGWYTEPEGGQRVTSIEKAQTLYAQWQ